MVKLTRLAALVVIASWNGRCAAGDYESYILGTNPAAYWGLNEPSGGSTAADLSGNGYDMTYLMPGTMIPPFNDPQTTTPGVPGFVYSTAGTDRATYFNGNLTASAYSTSGGATDRPLNELDPGPSVLNWPDFFSCEAWVKDLEFSAPGAVNDTARQIICPDTMWGFGTEQDRIHFVTFGKLDYYSPAVPSFADGQWHQVGFTWSSTGGVGGVSRATFYLDGADVGFQDATAATSGLRGDTGLDMVDLGRRRADTNGQQWIGYIDEVAVWHSLRSDADFAASYAAAFPPTFTWYGAASSDWGTATSAKHNWSATTVPDGSGIGVVFGLPGANPAVDLGAAGRTVGAMNFAGDVGTTVTSASGNTLTFYNGSNAAIIKAAGSHTIAAAISLASSATVNVTESGETLLISGVISGSGGIAKSGIGRLTLTQSNGYLGATSVNSGVLQLSGPNGSLTATSGITLNGGTILLNNAAGDAAKNSRLPAATITANGGGITYTNAAGSNYAQTVGQLVLAAGQTVITSSNEIGAANTSVLTLGANSLSPINSIATVAFLGPNLGVNGTRNSIQVSGQGATAAGEIIGPWATTGGTAVSDYAIYAANGITAANIAASPESNWTDPTSTGNYTMNASTALSTNRSINTLRYSGVAVASLSLNGNSLNTTGILAVGPLSIADTSTGYIIAGSTPGATLYLASGGGDLAIGVPIADNPGGEVNVVVSGNGRVILSGVNIYSGLTYVNGVLNVSANGNMGDATSALALMGGALQVTSGSFSLDDGAGTNRPVFLGTAGGTFDIAGGAALTVDGLLSGGGLTKAGSGTLVLANTAANTYAGGTRISGGFLQVAADGQLGAFDRRPDFHRQRHVAGRRRHQPRRRPRGGHQPRLHGHGRYQRQLRDHQRPDRRPRQPDSDRRRHADSDERQHLQRRNAGQRRHARAGQLAGLGGKHPRHQRHRRGLL